MKKYISLAVTAATIFGLSSCLKDKNLNLDPAKTPATIEFSTINDNPVDTGANFTSYSRSFPILPSNTSTIDVAYTGAGAAPSDITVNIVASTANLAAYNAQHDDDDAFTILPADLFTIPSSVVIKKGTRKATVTMTIKTTSPFDLNENYAIPLSISSVSTGTISQNYGTIILGIKGKNALDGDYVATGWVFHPGAPRAIKDTYHVGTGGVATSIIPVADLGGSNYYFQVDVNGSTLSNYKAVGATPAAPSSGLMTADNPGGTDYSSSAPNVPGQGEYTVANYNNTYDPATKTFKLHFGYGGGSSSQNGWTRQFYMKLVKK